METQCKNAVFLHNAWERNTGKQKELQITSIKHYMKIKWKIKNMLIVVIP